MVVLTFWVELLSPSTYYTVVSVKATPLNSFLGTSCQSSEFSLGGYSSIQV